MAQARLKAFSLPDLDLRWASCGVLPRELLPPQCPATESTGKTQGDDLLLLGAGAAFLAKVLPRTFSLPDLGLWRTSFGVLPRELFFPKVPAPKSIGRTQCGATVWPMCLLPLGLLAPFLRPPFGTLRKPSEKSAIISPGWAPCREPSPGVAICIASCASFCHGERNTGAW